MGHPGITNLRPAGDSTPRPAASPGHNIGNLHIYVHHKCPALDDRHRASRRDHHDGYINDRYIDHLVNHADHHTSVDHDIHTTIDDGSANALDHPHQPSGSADQRDPDAVPTAVAVSFSVLSMT